MTAGLVLLTAGLWLLWPASSRSRLTSGHPSRAGQGIDMAAVVLGLGVAVLVSGGLGVFLGAGAGLAARWGLQRIGPDKKPAEEALARQAPDAVDCLASCLAAGAPLWTALPIVADAFGEPLAGMWRRAGDRHELGSPTEEVFAEWLDEPLLAPVARLLVRSAESGGALATSLVANAERMREERAGALELRARAVGVQAVVPLGLCFLPAFILLAVVPIVGSLVTELL